MTGPLRHTDRGRLGDGHAARGSRALPAARVDRLRAADLIIHAGDFTMLAFLLNPGSPPERRSAPTRTMVQLVVEAARIAPELVALET